MDHPSHAREVTVWGKPYVVVIHQKSTSVWEASGDYMGEQITVKDRSEGLALNLWRNVATFKANP